MSRSSGMGGMQGNDGQSGFGARRERPPERPSVQAAAREYQARGWVPIPLHPRSKVPTHENWPDRRISASNVDAEFLPKHNIGIVLGEASGGAPGWSLVDVDCDTPEAVRAASLLLPPTALISGRASKPASHYWYLVEGQVKTAKFALPARRPETTSLNAEGAEETQRTQRGAEKTPQSTRRGGDTRSDTLPARGGPGLSSSSARSASVSATSAFRLESVSAAPFSGMLVEMRGDGCQTMAPPSIHPCGELVRWESAPPTIRPPDPADWGSGSGGGALDRAMARRADIYAGRSILNAEPARAERETLVRAVRKVAAAALLARHYPAQGTRDEAAMALTGMLLRGGWTVEETDEFVTVVARVARDEEWKKRAKGAQTARSLAADEAVTGGPRLTQLLVDGERVVAKVREWLGLAGGFASYGASYGASHGGAMLPAGGFASAGPGTLSSYPSFHSHPDSPREEAYYGLAGEIARIIEPHSEADPLAVLVQLLAAMGNIVGRRAYFAAEEDRHHPNLFVVLVGETANGRKGTSWGQAMRPVREVAPDWLRGHVTSGLSSGEGLIHLLRDRSGKTDEGRAKGAAHRKGSLWDDEDDEDETGDGETGAGEGEPALLDPVAGLKKRLLVRESEFASVLKMFAREGNTLSAVLRQAWDGDTLGVLTKRFAERASGAHISVVGHITAQELLHHLSQTEAADGLGNRFLWFCTRRSKLLPDGGRLCAEDFAPLKPRLQQVMAFFESLDSAHPLELTRDPTARTLWHEAYPRLSQGRLGIAGALTARAEAQTMRLACIYALLDCSRVIHEQHLRAALALWDYAVASVHAIFGDQLSDPVAEKLLSALRAAPGGLGRVELFGVLGRNVPVEQLNHALSVLHSGGLARMERIATSGRTREQWYATTSQPPAAIDRTGT